MASSFPLLLLPFMLAAGLCVAFSPVATTSTVLPSAAAATCGSSASLAAAGKLEAILFDCDGVLADTERDGHRLAFNRAFANSLIDEEWSIERYGKLLETGGGKERMIAHWDEVGFPSVIPILGRYARRSRTCMRRRLRYSTS